MSFDNDWKPARFVVFAELTENSHPNADDKGYRYRVYLSGRRMDTLRDAEVAIKENVELMGKRFDETGLIDWGKAAKREYAIYECTEWKRVK